MAVKTFAGNFDPEDRTVRLFLDGGSVLWLGAHADVGSDDLAQLQSKHMLLDGIVSVDLAQFPWYDPPEELYGQIVAQFYGYARYNQLGQVVDAFGNVISSGAPGGGGGASVLDYDDIATGTAITQGQPVKKDGRLITRITAGAKESSYDPTKWQIVNSVFLDSNTSDVGADIQVYYDAGIRTFDWDHGKTYPWLTPVFFDDATVLQRQRVRFNMNGATIAAGPNLPSTAAATFDVNRGWALFLNCNRSAWNTGTNVVTCNSASQSAGAGEIPSMARMDGGTFDGQNQNVSFCFGNNANAHMKDMLLYRGYNLQSWTNYVDSATMDDCGIFSPILLADHITLGATERPAILRQTNYGDGGRDHVPIGHGRSYSGIYRNVHGKEIPGAVGGNYAFRDCTGVKYHSGHIEGDQREDERPIGGISVDCTQMSIEDSEFWLGAGMGNASLPNSIGISEVQQVVLANASGGTFSVTIFGRTISGIAYNAADTAMQDALVAGGIPAAQVAVTRSGADGFQTYTLTYDSQLGDCQTVAVGNALTGSAPTVVAIPVTDGFAAVKPAIIINDTDGDNYTDLRLRDVQFKHSFVHVNAPTAYDDGQDDGYDIFILQANDSTRIRCENVHDEIQVAGTPHHYRYSTCRVGAQDVYLQAAIKANEGLIATGNFEIKRKTGQIWDVTPLDRGVPMNCRKQATPLFPSGGPLATGVIPKSGAGLTNGTTYEYAFALMDMYGNFSQVSTVVDVTATSSGTNRISVLNYSNVPGRLFVWRKSGTGVLTAPDAFAVFPTESRNIWFVDSGNHINKKSWIRAGIPIPNTVALTDTTTNCLVVDGLLGELQKVTLVGATSGNWTATVKLGQASEFANTSSFTTGNIAYNATGQDIEAALRTAGLSFDDIHVAGPAGGPWCFTYHRKYLNVASVVCTSVSLAGRTPGFTVTEDQAGTNRPGFLWPRMIRTKGTNELRNVTSKTADGSTLASLNVGESLALMECEPNAVYKYELMLLYKLPATAQGVAEVQTFTMGTSGAANIGGTFDATINGRTVTGIPWNADAFTFKQYLVLGGLDGYDFNVTRSGSDGAQVYTITYRNGFGPAATIVGGSGTNLQQQATTTITVATSVNGVTGTTSEVQSLTFNASTLNGGTWSLSGLLGSFNVTGIPWNVTAAALQTLIQTATSQAITVSLAGGPGPSQVFTLTYPNSLGNVVAPTASATGLTRTGLGTMTGARTTTGTTPNFTFSMSASGGVTDGSTHIYTAQGSHSSVSDANYGKAEFLAGGDSTPIAVGGTQDAASTNSCIIKGTLKTKNRHSLSLLWAAGAVVATGGVQLNAGSTLMVERVA